MSFEPERIQAIAELLRQVSQAHREAFEESDGVDPEWAAWFAARLHETLEEALGEPPRRPLSEGGLADLLAEAEQEHLITSPGRDWPSYYAEFLIARLL